MTNTLKDLFESLASATNNETAAFYCPYIPLQVSGTIADFGEMKKIEQIDEKNFILRWIYGCDLTENQVHALNWVINNVPKNARKFESDMEKHDRTHLVRITLSEQYAVLFKMFVL